MSKSRINRTMVLLGAAAVGGVLVFACQLGLSRLRTQTQTSATTGLASSDAKEPAAPVAQRKILYYWDPMLGPSSIAHAPGKSAMGMDLEPVYEDQQSGGPTVKIDPTIVQNMGVRTAQVTRGPLSVTVRAFGILEVPEPAIYEVNLKVNGWIEKIYANTEGMHVRKGEPLFDLYSPDVQVAAEELISAIATRKSLDPKATDAVQTESQNLIESAKQKLRLWGISEQDIDAIAQAHKAPQTVAFRSPADGDLVEKTVVEGSAVQAGTKLMRIEDHSRLWLDAQVYEDQIPLIRLGEAVEATVDSVPGKTFSGPVMFIHPHIDHMTRTVTVRVALDNPEHQLHPGMYATANIVTKPVADAVLVPREAVIDTGTRQIAFVADSDGHFDPRKVRMGLAGDEDQVEILQGLAPGEQVVTSGQFLLDVESRTTEAIDKLRNGSAITAPSIPADALVVVHCPMTNADWIQKGSSIANPFLGSAMGSCGSVTKQIDAPTRGTPLDALVGSYLLVAKGLDTDILDAAAIQSLKNAAGHLSVDQDSQLRNRIADLSAATGLTSARAAFQSVSFELIHLLQTSPQ